MPVIGPFIRPIIGPYVRSVTGGSGICVVIGAKTILHLHAIPIPRTSWLYNQAVQLTFLFLFFFLAILFLFF
jgi:hypothetical protein